MPFWYGMDPNVYVALPMERVCVLFVRCVQAFPGILLLSNKQISARVWCLEFCAHANANLFFFGFIVVIRKPTKEMERYITVSFMDGSKIFVSLFEIFTINVFARKKKR